MFTVVGDSAARCMTVPHGAPLQCSSSEAFDSSVAGSFLCFSQKKPCGRLMNVERATGAAAWREARWLFPWHRHERGRLRCPPPPQRVRLFRFGTGGGTSHHGVRRTSGGGDATGRLGTVAGGAADLIPSAQCVHSLATETKDV